MRKRVHFLRPLVLQGEETRGGGGDADLAHNVVPVWIVLFGALQVAGIDVPRLMLLLPEQDDSIEVKGQAVVVPVTGLPCRRDFKRLLAKEGGVFLSNPFFPLFC